MSILIKGMKMPTSCAVCPFENYGDCYGGKIKAIMDIDDYVSAGKRHPRCPLVEIPPHGRLIDADALERRTHYDDFDCLVLDASDINDAPTIIEAEEGCGRCDYCRILQTGTCRYGEENE